MNLVNLPDEILLIIFKHLDIKSLNCLYTACVHVQNIIRTYGAIKTCNLSLSNMANAETLNLKFFKDISRTLKELNVCGMINLNKSALLPAMRRFQCLDTLDVTYTKITITDFIELHSLCPTITNIGINFSFGKFVKNSIKEATLKPYQQVFSSLQNVHFVGNRHNLLYNQLPCIVLKKAKQIKLQYTIIDDNDVVYNTAQGRENILNFDNFTIYFSNTVIRNSGAEVLYHGNDKVHGRLKEMAPFDELDFRSYEILVTNVRRKCSAKAIYYATPIFENFFRTHNNLHLYENIELHITNDFEVLLDGNECVMVWNKSETVFDHKFFSNLWCKLKALFPCYFDSLSNVPVPADYDLYVTFPREIEHNTEIVQEGFKRKRLGPPNRVLNYDLAFKEKNKLQLALMFDGNITSAVSLSTNCDYLKKITYLSLSGQVRYSSDFFNVLFRCCHNLITLRVQGNSFGSCSSAITRSLPLSQSIKNIHLTDRDIDFPTLFSSMSQCKMLENVHISAKSFSTNIDASVVFEKCVHLYCLYLYIYSSFSSKTKVMKTFRSAKQNQINVKIFSNHHIICDPFSNMYSLNLLQ